MDSNGNDNNHLCHCGKYGTRKVDNAAAGEITTAEITGHNASTRAHVKYLVRVAAEAVEAVQEVRLAVSILDDHLGGEPTAKQNATFVAWFEAELYAGGAYDRQRELDLLALWRKLHPGTSPGIAVNLDDEPPF